MKTIRPLFILFAVVFAFIFITSCTENFSTAEIDLGEVSLKIPIYTDSLSVSVTNDFRPFTGRLDKLSLRDTTVFSGFIGFQTLPKQLFIKNVRIQIKKEQVLKGSKIHSITSTAYDNFNGNEISSYKKEGVIDFETEYYDDSKLTNYVRKIFASLEEEKAAVNIVLSGMTDIEAEDEDTQIGMITILVEVSANIELK